ncbi:MAG: rhomboid family intramembrane serine protease [Solirubrobacteraceae bacterium]
MTSTQVGMRCPECAKQRTRVVRMRNMAKVPQVTYALIVINAIVFLAEGNLSFGGGPTGKLYEEGALLGSIAGVPKLGVAHDQFWRIVTGGFLHENLLHIGFNMYVLYILGLQLEPVLGRVKFGLIYAVSLLTGSLGALLVSPHSFTVGASGAVFGIMGAFAVELRSRNMPIMRGGLGGVGGLILINLLISFTLPGISWGGHVGGLIGGTLAAAVIQLGERMRAQTLALIGCVVIAIAAVAGTIAVAKSSEQEGATIPVGVLTPQR